MCKLMGSVGAVLFTVGVRCFCAYADRQMLAMMPVNSFVPGEGSPCLLHSGKHSEQNE